jgi:hypothetical protein
LEVTIYNNSSSNNTVSKSITAIKTMTCQGYKDCNLVNPQILIDYDTVLFSANYMYIPLFNRYYYITDITSINGRQILVSGHTDVLMSFPVRSLSGVVARNENAYNLYLQDKMFRVNNFNYVVTKNFQSGFTPNSSIIFTVAG